MKHKLTEEQRNNLQKYGELLASKDEESVKLGMNLFYNDFRNCKIPVRKFNGKGKPIWTDFVFIEKSDQHGCEYIPFTGGSWWDLARVEDLLNCGWYYR